MKLNRKQLRRLACHTRAHCRACRTDADWRENVTGLREFPCPHGVTKLTMPVKGAGDVIENITSAVGIKPCGGCKRRKEIANKIFPLNKD